MSKVPLEIDWEEILPGMDDGRRRRSMRSQRHLRGALEIFHLPDHELQERIERLTEHLNSEIGMRLVDKDAKLKASLAQMHKELDSRKRVLKAKVPQQKNEYDCGLFVLYFIERFIEEAPKRLQGNELARFDSSKWFQPEDASGLRKRIRDLLNEIFRHAEHKNGTSESVCSCDSSEDD